MKILMQIGSYFPIVAGAEVFAQKVSEHLAIEGHRVDVVTLNEGNLEKFEEINGVRVYRVGSLAFPNLKLLSGIISIAAKSIELDKKENYDIIHSHLTFPTGQAGTILKKLRNKPHIITVQGGDLLDYQEFTGKFGGALRPLISWSLRNCDMVHAVSNYTSELSLELGARRTVVVPNGVYLEDFVPMDKSMLREKHGYPQDKKILISVSRLTPKNGMDYFIKACAALVPKHKDFILVIIGDGPQREELEALVKELGMDKIVKLTGYLPHREIPELLNIADIFVRPSLQEGFGISFIEAMACKVAVIGSDVGGIPDIIDSGDNGFLVKPGSVRDLAEKIDILLSDEGLRQRFIDRGYQTVREKFTWSRVFDKMDNLYNGLVNGR